MHQSSTPKALPKDLAMGPMRLDTLSLVVASARRMRSTTADACINAPPNSTVSMACTGSSHDHNVFTSCTHLHCKTAVQRLRRTKIRRACFMCQKGREL